MAFLSRSASWVQRSEAGRGGAFCFASSDYLGTHSKMLNSAGAVTSTRQYDAFGLPLSGSDPSPFGFAGSWGYQEDHGGLKLLGHRHYDPYAGRFLTRDPIKDGRNWYAYCENNPTASVDPDGLHPISVLARFLLRWLIDQVIDMAINEVMKAVDPGATVHKRIADKLKKMVKDLGLSEVVQVEQPYFNGKPVSGWRPAGAVVPDVSIGPLDGRAWAVIDWKTGKAKINKRRLRQFKQHVFGGTPGIVVGVRPGGVDWIPVY